MTTPFQRQSYILEFITCGVDIELLVNGKHENQRRASKATLLALWVGETLHLPVSRKTWASVEDSLTTYGYTLAPAYAEKRAEKLHSFYTITRDVGIEIDGWPVSRAKDTVNRGN